MQIEILQTLTGARAARGLAVVIDVFRAFSLEACLFGRGAAAIYAVGGEEQARALKAAHPDWLLIGERGGKILPGFDYGNSPSQTEAADVRGRTIVHTTSAGTQGLNAAAAGTSKIITGSLRNAAAIARYLRGRQPELVCLCAMGLNGKTPTPEDDLCAAYIKALVEDRPINMAAGLAAVHDSAEGRKFFDPAQQEVFPQRDYELCTQLDVDNFVITAAPIGNETFLMNTIKD